MRWIDLIWLPPVMLAVAIVLGTSGREGVKAIGRGILHAFFYLTLGVVVVGVVIHLVSEIFA